MPNMVQIMKQAAYEAVEAGKPVNLLFGVVTAEEPLTIKTDQQKMLSAPFLLLAQGVTEHEVCLTARHITEPAGAHSHTHEVSGETGASSGGGGSHSHGISLRTSQNDEGDHQHKILIDQLTFTAHSGLLAGETVLLLRMQGGQRYLVLDRVVSV